MRLLTLVDKYHLDVLKNKLIARFSADWPTDLVGWDITDVSSEMYEEAFNDETLDDEDSREICRTDWPEEVLPEPISAAIFAKEAKVPSVLTAVFFDMYRAARDIDWDKVDPQCPSIRCKGARWSLATAEQLRKLFLVQDAIDKKLGHHIPYILTDDDLDDACTSMPHCQRLRSDKYHEVTQKIWDTRDPLGVLRQLDRWGKEAHLCSSCRDLLRLGVTYAKKWIWVSVKDVVEPV